MKMNKRQVSVLMNDVEKARKFLIVVEGKKDKSALEKLGFERIFVLHESGKSFGEKIEKITELCGKNEKVCILTDFDRKGKKLYMLLKSKLGEAGVRLNSSLRGALLRARVSHVEGLYGFLRKGAGGFEVT